MKRRRHLLKKLRRYVKEKKYEIWSQDECHFQQHGSRCRMWIPPEDKDPVVYQEPTRKSISVFGSVKVSTGRLITQKEPIFNAPTFITFLDYFIKKAYRKKTVMVILDNSKYHRAKIVTDWADDHSKKIKLEFLPPYSPDLNPIERVWKLTRKKCVHNEYFPTIDSLSETVFGQFKQWERPNSVLYRLCAVN